jgi:hypothetical protein
MKDFKLVHETWTVKVWHQEGSRVFRIMVRPWYAMSLLIVGILLGYIFRGFL